MYQIDQLVSSITHADQLLDLIFQKPIENIELPIDVDHIANSIGISIIIANNLTSLDEISRVENSNGVGTIYINSEANNYIPRRRFTIAHSIGHLILHSRGMHYGVIDTQTTMSRTDSYWNKNESEANNFAADLLMPNKLILKAGDHIIQINGGRITAEKFISIMADIFYVPHKAMIYKLQDLKIIQNYN